MVISECPRKLERSDRNLLVARLVFPGLGVEIEGDSNQCHRLFLLVYDRIGVRRSLNDISGLGRCAAVFVFAIADLGEATKTSQW